MCFAGHFFEEILRTRVGFPTRISIVEIASPQGVLTLQQHETNPLQDLARRVRSGDSDAADEFRREMSLALEGMVRLALRKRACFSPFEEHARAEADRLQDISDGQLSRDELARQTAGQVCQAMIGRLQAGGRIQDTIVCVGAGCGSLERQTVESSESRGVSCQWSPATDSGRVHSFFPPRL
jgi:hypothetical protein